MTYEKAVLVQAELRIVRGSTNERKHMSTKTTFKRIALVTVAALGFGVLSVAPSNAALGTTDAIKTTFSATGAITGTTADPFAVGSAINLNVIVDLSANAVSGETFTITYNAYNPKGETITGITLVETSTSVSLLGNGSETGTVKGVGNTLEFKDSITATASTVATLTIPAAAITTGGAYKVYATKVSGSSAVTLDATSADGTDIDSLALGLLNVAGAAVTQGTLTGAAAGNAVTGNNARMKFFFPKVAAADVYRITSSGVGTILSEQGDGANTTPSAVSGTTYAAGMNLVAASAATASNVELNLTSDVAGVQTLTFWKQNASTGVLTAVFTGTVTWGAAPAYVDSTAFLSATTGSSATVDTLAADRKSSAVYSASAIARISVKQYTDAAKTIQTAGTAKAVVVTITGAGAVDTVASNGATRGSQATVAASTTASTDSEFYVYSDGRAGAATIAITVNGVALKSYTWNFTGTATSYKEDALTSPSKTYIGVGETGTLSVFSYDANANLVSEAPSVNATSDTATIATVSLTGTGSVTVTGVAAGKTNINICATACASATVKLSIPVEITGKTAETVTVSFDKASYEPGEKMVLTVSAVDSNGRPVADGARALLAAAMTSNVSFGGASVALPAASVTLAGGTATYTLYAPSSSGTVTVTGKEGTATNATTKKAITASAVVVNSGVDAATDAANEARDAADAATDAALQAAEAADAATVAAQEASDAVAALSESVTKLVAGLQNQIKSLAAVLARIAKKVKA